MAADRVRNPPLAKNRPVIIVLDTSFLLTMLEQRRDLEEELRDLIKGRAQIALVDAVQRELQHLGRTRSSKIGGLANAALELVKLRGYAIFDSGIETSDADSALLSFSLARRQEVAVATVDRKLRAILSRFGLPTIFPKRSRGLMLSSSTSSSSI